MKKENHIETIFSMHRVMNPEPANEHQFDICVTANPLTEDVTEINIEMYQSAGPDEVYHPDGTVLVIFPMESGEIYTFPYDDNDIVTIVVRYKLRNHAFWKVAATGTWCESGGYFNTGQRINPRTELFRRV